MQPVSGEKNKTKWCFMALLAWEFLSLSFLFISREASVDPLYLLGKETSWKQLWQHVYMWHLVTWVIYLVSAVTWEVWDVVRWEQVPSIHKAGFSPQYPFCKHILHDCFHFLKWAACCNCWYPDSWTQWIKMHGTFSSYSRIQGWMLFFQQISYHCDFRVLRKVGL